MVVLRFSAADIANETLAAGVTEDLVTVLDPALRRPSTQHGLRLDFHLQLGQDQSRDLDQR
jgi:hypothetical protein